MLLLFIQAFWLGLPAGISNMIPPIATKFFPKLLNIPVDGQKKYKGKRILGDHKTVRGLVVGILFGEITFLLQQSVTHIPFIQQISILPYNQLPFFFGFLFGIGSLGADALKSFFKRQLGISSGSSWIPFDQADWLIGTLLVLILFVKIPMSIILVGLSFGIVLQVLVKLLGFYLGIDKHAI